MGIGGKKESKRNDLSSCDIYASHSGDCIECNYAREFVQQHRKVAAPSECLKKKRKKNSNSRIVCGRQGPTGRGFRCSLRLFFFSPLFLSLCRSRNRKNEEQIYGYDIRTRKAQARIKLYLFVF